MASSAPQEQAIRRPIIHAGMDFGTAYSSISYVIPDSEGRIGPDRCRLLFSNVYLSEGNMVQTRIPKGDYTGNDYNGGWIKWFKLSLLHPDDLPKGVRASKILDISTREREALDLSAAGAVAIYFESLLGQFLDTLSLSIGVQELAQHDVEITVTVPGIWPVDARRRLHHALQPAITAHTSVRLAKKFVPEGEATAIALLSDPRGTGNFWDSIAYKVTSAEPLIVEEISPGKCIFAGGVLVDEAFLQLVRDKTRTATSSKTMRDLTDNDFQDFVDEIWDRIKVKHSIDARRKEASLPRKFLSSRAIRPKMTFDASGQESNRQQPEICRGAVLHAIQAHTLSMTPGVQIDGRASGESYGVDRRTDGFMHWLIRQRDVLSATGPNRRALPPDALRRDTNGRFFVNMYRQREPGTRVELFDCIVLTAVGEQPEMEFDFRWVGGEMSFVLVAMATDTPKLLWNPDNVKDVAESVGISSLNEEALKCLAQDVEYRIGQVIVESLRFMRAARRTTLTVNDISLALRALDVEPLYGYDSTRPLRYGEASLGPGQPLFYIEDEEVDFEKLINAPLPKVPRDMGFTAHWLAIEGVQPSIPQNPTTSESRSQELLPKGPGANPALSALAGNDNVSMKPSVKHIVSKELILYFDKIQAAVLDDNPDEEVVRLRQAALGSVRDDPGLHQLIPYFITFIMDRVTHHLDDTFTLKQMMELTNALIENKSLFLDPYASPLSAPALTCLMARKLGTDEGTDALKEQYDLRQLAASLVGRIARKYSASNTLLRPKLTRTCLKYFLDPTKPPAVLYGAIHGLLEAGGPEAIRVLVLRNLQTFDSGILQPLKEKAEGTMDYEMLVQGIVQAVASLADHVESGTNGVNGTANVETEISELKDFIGPIIGGKIASAGNRRLVRTILDARFLD
ncbi:transcription initiation factor TFIID subunit 6 [Fusarium mexicanum]|uniref:TBP-associated factor 6 n=1 Tax=Fusarium mexicanum TaxID=751941 RepID=A0A8H5NB57_9HYPO|nr:transcription initiation factor TFIID subunit 6 [Fusarium mexicanum]